MDPRHWRVTNVLAELNQYGGGRLLGLLPEAVPPYLVYACPFNPRGRGELKRFHKVE